MVLSTTTVTITGQAADVDPYEAATVVTIAENVRAHLSSPTGDDLAVAGDKEVITAVCYLPDGTAVLPSHRLTDRSGIVHDVVWVRERVGLGLGHVAAGIRSVRGGASG